MKTEPSKRWTILGFLMALCFISHLNRVSLAIAADERIMPRYGISPKQMGVVYSAFLIIYTLAMIPGGFFIDRVGTRRALMVMGFGSALFAALTGGLGLTLLTAASLWAGLLGVRSLMGLVTTPLHPGCARAVAEWFPPTQRTFANGLVTGAALLGIACTYPVFGWLIDKIDWPAAFVVCAAATALVTAAWAVYARGDSQMIRAQMEPGRSPSVPAHDEPNLLANPSLILVTLSYAAVGYFQYLFFYWIHYYFDTILQVGKEQSRVYAGLPTLAMAFCMPLGGWLCDRFQHRYGLHRSARLIAIAGMVLSAILLWCALWAPGQFWMVACFTLSLGALGLSEGSFWLTAVELGGRKGGTAAAIMNTGGNGIGLLAPLLTPFISDWLGWRSGIAIGGVVALLGALCWIGVRRDSS